MLNLTISDLIALRDYCHEESLGFKTADSENKMTGKDYLKWHDRFKLVDKELSDRVEKIFDGSTLNALHEFNESKPSITNKLFETGGKVE